MFVGLRLVRTWRHRCCDEGFSDQKQKGDNHQDNTAMLGTDRSVVVHIRTCVDLLVSA